MDNYSINPIISSSLKAGEKVQIESKELEIYDQKSNIKFNNIKENNIEDNQNKDIENIEVKIDNNKIENTVVNNEANISVATGASKDMKIFSLNLNSYWIEFMSTISLILTIITFELLAYIILQSLNSLFEATITLEEIKNAFSVIIDDIGLKWYVFIEISQHLSVGFFCLTTFSQILNETQNIKKFYILNCIKLAVYYAGSVIFLKIIKEDFKQLIKYYIDKEREEKKLKIKQELLDKIYEYLDKFIAFIFFHLTDFLSTFNIFLDQLVLGSLYIFLFITPYNCLNKNLIYFRLVSIIFVLFIIISIILRALHKSEILILNEFISPILLGPKNFNIWFFY